MMCSYRRRVKDCLTAMVSDTKVIVMWFVLATTYSHCVHLFSNCFDSLFTRLPNLFNVHK